MAEPQTNNPEALPPSDPGKLRQELANSVDAWIYWSTRERRASKILVTPENEQEIKQEKEEAEKGQREATWTYERAMRELVRRQERPYQPIKEAVDLILRSERGKKALDKLADKGRRLEHAQAELSRLRNLIPAQVPYPDPELPEKFERQKRELTATRTSLRKWKNICHGLCLCLFALVLWAIFHNVKYCATFAHDMGLIRLTKEMWAWINWPWMKWYWKSPPSTITINVG